MSITKTTKEQRDALDAEVFSYIKVCGQLRNSDICDAVAAFVERTLPAGKSVSRYVDGSLQRLRGKKIRLVYPYWSVR